MVRGAADKEADNIQAGSLVTGNMEKYVRRSSTQRKTKVDYRKTEAWQRQQIARFLL